MSNHPPLGAATQAQLPFSTCDFCDGHKSHASQADFRVLPPIFHTYGARLSFFGPVQTVQCFEDNTPVKAAVESPGHGAVLVVDGGGSLRRALLGGDLAAAAARNGWAGLVIHGAVRDVQELRTTDIGIRALGLIPMPTVRRTPGVSQQPVVIAGVRLTPGDWLYADEDGIVVHTEPLHAL